MDPASDAGMAQPSQSVRQDAGAEGNRLGRGVLVRSMADAVAAWNEQHGARRRSTDFRRGKKLGSKDHLITLTKPKIRPQWMTEAQYESLPDTLTVRELDVGGKVLVTTLLCPKTTSKSDLKALYKRRWNVELDIRNIKTTLGMETLSCKTPLMGEKEMWVYLLAYAPKEVLLGDNPSRYTQP